MSDLTPLLPLSSTFSHSAGGDIEDIKRVFDSIDWAATTLGPQDLWSRSLRSMISMMMAHPFPNIILWGPDLIQIYNAGYRRIVADRHPKVFGMGNKDAWPEVWHINAPIWDRVMSKGESFTFDDQLYPLILEGELRDVYLTLSYSPIYDDDDNIGGVLVTLFDTTDKVNSELDRRRMEQQREELLREIETQNQRLHEAVRTSPAFMAMLSGPEHVFELVNEPYLSLIGDRDILNKPVRVALPEVEGQGFFELLDSVYRTGEPFIGGEVSLMMQRAPGAPLEERWVEFVYQPIKNSNGAVTGIFAHGVDLTERIKAEKERNHLLDTEREAREAAEKASKAKDEFLAILSHELRTPLTAILGWTYLLSQTRDDQLKWEEALAAIDRNASALAQLIDDLLDVTRIQSGKIHLETAPVSLQSVIASSIEIASIAAKAKSIQFKTSIDANVGMVDGDELRLRQVLLNLITNAVKFSPENSTIEIALKSKGKMIELIVSDQGIGIDAEFLPYIFDKFSQAETAMRRKHGGLGLGLSIVKGFVELHNGTIEATSPGAGKSSTFTITLPVIERSLNTR